MADWLAWMSATPTGQVKFGVSVREAMELPRARLQPQLCPSNHLSRELNRAIIYAVLAPLLGISSYLMT